MSFISPLALLSLPIVSGCLWKSCSGTCELLPRAVWLFFNGLFAENILYLFIQDQQQKAVYTSGSLQQQLRRVFKEKTGEAFTQWATWELQLRLFYLSPLFSLPFYNSFSLHTHTPFFILVFFFFTIVFVIYLSSTEHRSLKLIQFGLDHFSLFLLLSVPGARRDSVINVSAFQPLSSTCRNQ